MAADNHADRAGENLQRARVSRAEVDNPSALIPSAPILLTFSHEHISQPAVYYDSAHK